MADDNGNGRVTLAVIQTDIRHLTSEVGRLAELLGKACSDQSAQRDDILRLQGRLDAEVLRAQTEHGTFRRDIDDVAGNVERLRTRDLFGSVGAGLLALAAGAIGWLKP